MSQTRGKRNFARLERPIDTGGRILVLLILIVIGLAAAVLKIPLYDQIVLGALALLFSILSRPQ